MVFQNKLLFNSLSFIYRYLRSNFLLKMNDLTVKRTTTADPDFMRLVQLLDHELWNELNEDQATYDQFNKVPDLKTAVLLYINEEAVASGCFKEKAPQTVEIKRMFVKKDWRGRGLSKLILQELENWARELGYRFAVLETSIHFNTAQKLYLGSGYDIIDNYPPYEGLRESVCMRKSF